MFAAVHAPGKGDTVLECARQFTPRIELTSPNTLLLDIEGLGNLFGSPAEIAQAIAKRLGFPANVAVSADPDTAIYLACSTKGVTIISPGKEARALAALPIAMLPLSVETVELFECWGIRIFGQLAALPPLGIAARLGEEGIRLNNSRAEK